MTICTRDRKQILSEIAKNKIPVAAEISVPSVGEGKPLPTLDDVICAFKSLTSRACKKEYGIEKIFQRSSAEHIIRDKADYEARRKYIYENPMRWYYRYLNTKA